MVFVIDFQNFYLGAFMKKLVLAGLLFVSNQMAVAVNWVENPSNVGNGTMFVDIDSIKKQFVMPRR